VGQTRQRQVRLKTTFGTPCLSPNGIEVGRSAVWWGDEISVLSRAGSHYLCYVTWGYGRRFHMLAWLHKRAVREIPKRYL
jgi:hypothetical protein